jgi:holo-[acyl-carrier protein] synthase
VVVAVGELCSLVNLRQRRQPAAGFVGLRAYIPIATRTRILQVSEDGSKVAADHVREGEPVASVPGRAGLRVGIDLARIDEAARSLELFGKRYVERILTPREAADCLAAPAQTAARLAARFAAKEATIKVLRPAHWLDWRSIEVIRRPPGFTELALSGEAAELAEAAGLDDFSVSLAHEGHYATAVVVASTRKP